MNRKIAEWEPVTFPTEFVIFLKFKKKKKKQDKGEETGVKLKMLFMQFKADGNG